MDKTQRRTAEIRVTTRPRAASSVEEGRAVAAGNLTRSLFEFADTDRDGVLGRDEFNFSAYEKVDRDDNGITGGIEKALSAAAGIVTLPYALLLMFLMRSDES